MINNINISINITEEYANFRLDQAMAKLLPEYSREKLKGWIISGECLVNGIKRKPKDKLQGNELIEIKASIKEAISWQAEEIDIPIVYQDQDIIIINKPSNMVVHPAAGNYSGTLVNGLLNIFPDLANLPRAGIVHRLDKDTTGLMVVAKNLIAHNSIVKQIQERSVQRVYEAIVWGNIIAGATIDKPLGRHPHDRLKMAVIASGKEAITHYRVLEKFREHTYIRIKLETGRTHQIRVHMASCNYPLVGDPLYGGRKKHAKFASDKLQTVINSFNRQALHAKELSIIHPTTNELMSWQATLPEDFTQLLTALKKA